MIVGNQGVALRLVAKRTGNAQMAARAIGQMVEARDALSPHHSPMAGYLGTQLQAAQWQKRAAE